ncbi:MAG: hypothetical protein PHH08_04000 [Candidatus ainarchaeum sp.]|nr:hypothetical protein [Candidatus ainarchaeum sp.]
MRNPKRRAVPKRHMRQYLQALRYSTRLKELFNSTSENIRYLEAQIDALATKIALAKHSLRSFTKLDAAHQRKIEALKRTRERRRQIIGLMEKSSKLLKKFKKK